MHYHLHDEDGLCYGDLARFDDAALAAAEHVYPWCVADQESVEGILTVIEADVCIQECNDTP